MTTSDLAVSLAEAVSAAEATVNSLCDADLEGWEQLAAPLLECQESLKRLRDLERLITDVIVHRAGKKIEGVMIPGLGKVDSRRGQEAPRWRGEDLGREVAKVTAARLADDPLTFFDPDSGEKIPPAATVAYVAAQVAASVVDAAGLDAASKAWRVESLKKLGINAHQFKSSSPGTWKVTVTPGLVGETKPPA